MALTLFHPRAQWPSVTIDTFNNLIREKLPAIFHCSNPKVRSSYYGIAGACTLSLLCLASLNGLNLFAMASAKQRLMDGLTVMGGKH